MPEPIDTRRHFTGMLAGSAARFGPLAIAILLAPLLIRTFGEQRYGAYVLATSVASVLLLLDLGLGPAAEKLLAERLAAGSTAEAGVRGPRHGRRLAHRLSAPLATPLPQRGTSLRPVRA